MRASFIPVIISGIAAFTPFFTSCCISLESWSSVKTFISSLTFSARSSLKTKQVGHFHSFINFVWVFVSPSKPTQAGCHQFVQFVHCIKVFTVMGPFPHRHDVMETLDWLSLTLSLCWVMVLSRLHSSQYPVSDTVSTFEQFLHGSIVFPPTCLNVSGKVITESWVVSILMCFPFSDLSSGE